MRDGFQDGHAGQFAGRPDITGLIENHVNLNFPVTSRSKNPNPIFPASDWPDNNKNPRSTRSGQLDTAENPRCTWSDRTNHAN